MCGQGLWKSETRHSDQEPANQSHGTETEKGRVGLDINQPFKMAATRCLCSLLVFLICWASYAPQSFADLVMIKTPTLLRISTIFIPPDKKLDSGYIGEAPYHSSTSLAASELVQTRIHFPFTSWSAPRYRQYYLYGHLLKPWSLALSKWGFTCSVCSR